MTNSNDDIVWQTKLAARIHDPAEKALVLLRDPAGHEGGTSRALERLLNLGAPTPEDTLDPDNADALARVIFPHGLKKTMYRHVQRADWWASAADRPQWPTETIQIKGKSVHTVARSVQVRWANKPVLIHPLTGDELDLSRFGGLSDTDISDIKQRSFDHAADILKALGIQHGAGTLQQALLALWRFGPELTEEEDNGKLGALWKLLPADTRVPDHSIWDHLDLSSAFAGAFADDPKGEVALLALSIGPVQPFIAAARSTSDLWAGSHLLSRLAWEAMRAVCEALGPDAILFPRLRGVPQVDLWLRDTMKLPPKLFADCEWQKSGTDSNPLFSAALPNRFVALVPASKAKALAEEVETRVRAWLQEKGEEVVRRLLDEAGFDTTLATPFEQMRAQLAGFPEVHWAAVPFSLIRIGNEARQTGLDTLQLSAAMAPFFGVEEGQPCGFLASPAWKVLQESTQGIQFFAPNPGALYPAMYDLAERVMAAAKALRPFTQQVQTGWRCSLTGETEWLTTDRSQLARSFRQQSDTLWAKIATRRPAWAKKGEHLGGLPALKRLWPTLFAEEVGKALGNPSGQQRFVVSTHTMALAHQLDQWLERHPAPRNPPEKTQHLDPVALPHKLVRKHIQHPALATAKQLPALLDAADEDANDQARQDAEYEVRRILGVDGLETYYALLLMDGDRMGQILSGDEKYAITYRESFHPHVRKGFDALATQHPAIKRYGNQKRALSPNRHLAISGALNDFSLHIVRHVVEEEHLGRVIYAGGDDVLAMLPVADAFSAMDRLRLAYSGHDPAHTGGHSTTGLLLHNGFACLDGKLMRMMGRSATASCGLVIAHHQAPLAAVRRELEAAEKRAKNEGQRNAFSITIIKRAGGSLQLTASWNSAACQLLQHTRDFLSHPDVSRRAVYNTLEWLVNLPNPSQDPAMLATLLSYQFARQSSSQAQEAQPLESLCEGLVQLALQHSPDKALAWLGNFLGVAEFLARETRSGAPE